MRKNTAGSRNYSAFITRYNIYYNGETHYKETLEKMEKDYEDDYSQLVFVHPAEARGVEGAPQPSGDFTRSIEKAQKAIQLRSIKKKPARKPGKNNDPEYKAWLNREEYNPFLHNAWMMMGRSQFLNGDFLGAASTFFYISKHFSWLPQVVTEAKLWQARSYCSIDWLFEAEMILTRIKPDELTTKQLTYLYNLTFADLYVKSKNNAKAIPYLAEAVKSASGSQKTRLNFLLGQLYALEGNKQAAYKAFDAAGSSSGASYRTKLNARIKQSEVFTGSDIKSEVGALKRMTRYDRNKPYLDQIYYAIGNLYLSNRDTADAISNYALAIEKSTRSGIDQAIAQLTLGGLYYDLGEYEKAQPNYSSAISRVPNTYPDYQSLKRRSDYLDELAVYSQNVTLQDSLLKLSYLTPEEQTKVAERLIAELKKKEAEEREQAKREEYLANQAQQGNALGGNANAPTSYTMNSNNAWYFYNPATVTAGKTDFQRRWGSRKLEDDWRRRNKSSFAFTTPEESSSDDDSEESSDENLSEEEAKEKAEKEKADDPHNVEYYLRQIPKTDLERQICNDVIMEGLYNMGVILKDKLEDYPAAEREFNRLLTRYPDNIYRLDTYYNMYLMYVRKNDAARAEQYRQLIINDFPDSNYGQAMRDPSYFDNLRLMDQRQEAMYAKAYENYLANRNSAVHSALASMKRDFPMSPLMPKFLFIDALAYVTENNTEKFRETLAELLEKYPDSDVTPIAASYMKGLTQGRQLHSGSTNMRGMIWDIRLSNDSTATAAPQSIEFEFNPSDRQLLVLMYPTDAVSPNQLLFDVARHNFNSFMVKDFDLEQMNFGRLGLLIIKPFDNLAELNHYRSVMSSSNFVLPPEVRPVIISENNFKKLTDNGASFEDYFRAAAENNYRVTEETTLPADTFGPSEGIPQAAPAAVKEEVTAPQDDTFDDSADDFNLQGPDNQNDSELEQMVQDEADQEAQTEMEQTVSVTPQAETVQNTEITEEPAEQSVEIPVVVPVEAKPAETPSAKSVEDIPVVKSTEEKSIEKKIEDNSTETTPEVQPSLSEPEAAPSQPRRRPSADQPKSEATPKPAQPQSAPAQQPAPQSEPAKHPARQPEPEPEPTPQLPILPSYNPAFQSYPSGSEDDPLLD